MLSWIVCLLYHLRCVYLSVHDGFKQLHYHFNASVHDHDDHASDRDHVGDASDQDGDFNDHETLHANDGGFHHEPNDHDYVLRVILPND